MDYRIGQGYDVHQLREGLPMWLGGVRIESNIGFVAHSDGDVAIHALCDALLGALALGDIGQCGHYHCAPETENRFLCRSYARASCRCDGRGLFESEREGDHYRAPGLRRKGRRLRGLGGGDALQRLKLQDLLKNFCIFNKALYLCTPDSGIDITH